MCVSTLLLLFIIIIINTKKILSNILSVLTLNLHKYTNVNNLYATDSYWNSKMHM